jgi:hypothetical protein
VNGVRVTFGNGLMGVQPAANSTVVLKIKTTLGADGNVYPGSIASGQKLYYVASNMRQEVLYYCTNPESSVGGADGESLQEIRINSIDSLRMMDRLVSGTDYKRMDLIMKNNLFNQNSLPVLKRSDLRCNEIQTFTTLSYSDGTSAYGIVPTKNLYVNLPTNVDIINRGTIIDIMDPELESYFSLFELHMDKLNGSAHYYYTLDSLNFPVEVTVPLTLLSSSNNSYNSIQMTTLEAYVTSGDMHFIANYYALPDSNGNYDTNAICVMEIDDYPFKCTMTNVPSQNRFVYPGTSEFPYLDFPEGDKLVVLTLYSLLLGGDPVEVAKYTAYLTVRKDLQDIMASNLVMNTDGTTMTVYDIPVIKKSYYDNLANPQDFEINCLQKLIADPVLEDYRMLTDFANLKFSNTTGLIVNMLHNKAKYSFIRNGHLITFVINIENDPNIDATAGQIYIVGTNPIGEFRGHENSYAVRAYNGVREYWDYLRPISDDVVYIRDKGTRYIYTGDEWMIPIYTIPLSIELEVFRSNSYFDTDVQLMYDVKAAVISAFQSRFGINAYLYVSELTDVVQSVAGVDHCTVINPRSDIFFNYSVTELTQNELLAYTPEYVYFSESDIKVIVI